MFQTISHCCSDAIVGMLARGLEHLEDYYARHITDDVLDRWRTRMVKCGYLAKGVWPMYISSARSMENDAGDG